MDNNSLGIDQPDENPIARLFSGVVSWLKDTANVGPNLREVAQTTEQTKQVMEQHKVTSDKIAEQLVILNSYMERMEQAGLRAENASCRSEQSSLRIENVSYVIAVLTMASVISSAYSFLKDLDFPPIMAMSYALVSALLMVSIWWVCTLKIDFIGISRQQMSKARDFLARQRLNLLSKKAVMSNTD